MCGEQSGAKPAIHPTWGSPPRVRGTVASAGNQSSNLRITPACAGNRTACIAEYGVWEDHPRVCGEQDFKSNRNSKLTGSPPRVRGTGGKYPEKAAIDGITPACAGNRTACIAEYGVWEDHPRVCGEQDFKSNRNSKLTGSPPRVRGTGGKYPEKAAIDGITPACAGNSWMGRKRYM